MRRLSPSGFSPVVTSFSPSVFNVSSYCSDYNARPFEPLNKLNGPQTDAFGYSIESERLYNSWLSGDNIAEQAVHSIDIMSWSMGGKRPVSATGTGGRQYVQNRFLATSTTILQLLVTTTTAQKEAISSASRPVVLETTW
jgi:hypothetical protein